MSAEIASARVTTIALARPRDVPPLAAIERAAAEIFRGRVPEAVLEDATDEPSFQAAQAAGRLWVALVDDQPVGFALVEMLADGTPHLDELDVHPRHGRRGLGAALVRAVCDWAEGAGHAAITLTTFRAFPWNMPFYARHGFEEVPTAEIGGELREIIADEEARGLAPEDRVTMRRRFRSDR